MLPVLSREQSRAADAYTIAHEPIASIDLMERAARACTERILQLPLTIEREVFVVCGPGNNGGDGLAIARMLHQVGQRVSAVLMDPSGRMGIETQTQLERAEAAGVKVERPSSIDQFRSLDPTVLVVDALFGSGLDRPLNGFPTDVVRWINAARAEVVAIDLPSRMLCEGVVGKGEGVVRASVTLTLECPKQSFFFGENADYVGHWEVLPIGLDKSFLSTLPADQVMLEAADARAILPPRPRFAHKGIFGHALLLAGSEGMYGAAVLAARACVRSGVGRCTLRGPGSMSTAMIAAVPEAMCSADPDGETLTELPDLSRATAVGIGPGIGQDARTATLLKLLIQEARSPLVLDADALNILSENKTWLGFLPPSTILTPHPKEFDRMAGPCGDSAERLEKARAFALKYGVVLILKGAFIAVIAPDGKVCFNPTGNAGMAKGGSGDVLTGLLTGLRAQGIPSLPAALLGTYVHGLAGDLAADAIGGDGMTAIDIASYVPAAFKRLRQADHNSPATLPAP